MNGLGALLVERSGSMRWSGQNGRPVRVHPKLQSLIGHTEAVTATVFAAICGVLLPPNLRGCIRW